MALYTYKVILIDKCDKEAISMVHSVTLICSAKTGRWSEGCRLGYVSVNNMDRNRYKAGVYWSTHRQKGLQGWGILVETWETNSSWGILVKTWETNSSWGILDKTWETNSSWGTLVET